MSDVPNPLVPDPSAPRPVACAHEHSEPLWCYVHPADPQPGDEVVILNSGKPVARQCTFCGAILQPSWGCRDCEWVEAPRTLCDVLNRPTLVLARPCQEHA